MSPAVRLDAYITAQAAQPFDWAAHNCCHFVAGWVRAATGRDPMQGLPATPSRRAARRLERQLGGTLADAWAHRLGRAAIRPELAQAGDVVLVPVGADGAAVGICIGRQVALLTEADGIAVMPMAAASHAWRLHGAAGEGAA